MKRCKGAVLFISMMWAFSLVARNKVTTTYYAMRSQAHNTYRDLVGVVDYMHRYGVDDLNGVFAITPEYTRSTNPSLLADCFFGPDLCAAPDGDGIIISGSRVADRNTELDWLADYFGLPTDFQSMVQFSPVVENLIFDAQLYLGLDNLLENLWARAHVPYVYTRRSMGMRESIIDPGVNDYNPGYFTPDSVSRDDLLDSFSQYAICGEVSQLPNGVTFEPLSFSRLSDTMHAKHGFAELEVDIGYDILRNEEYHLGFYFRMGIPLGNRPDGKLFFEPVVGNGHHWLAGGGIWLHAVVWADERDDRWLTGHLLADFTNMFSTTQCRFFDIREKRNSRFILAERLTLPIEDGLHGDESMVVNFGDEIPTAQFKNVYAPVANVSSFDVQVNGGDQMDITLMLDYHSTPLIFNLGYNYWFRNCERVTNNPGCFPDKVMQKQWALKGDAHLFGFNEDTNEPVALSATQSRATLFTGLNFGPGKDFELGIANGGDPDTNPITIDSPDPAFSGAEELTAAPGIDEQINTSLRPRFIRLSSMDYCASSTESVLHTLFMHFSYELCTDKERIQPFIGAGGKFTIAFADDNPYLRTSISRCTNPCSENQCASCQTCLQCLRCGVYEWGVWLKGGIAFG